MSGYELLRTLLYSAIGIYVVINVDNLIDCFDRIADALEALKEDT